MPIIGDPLAYLYFGPKYLFSKLVNPILFPLSGLRSIKSGTTVIWVPENKKQAVKVGIGLLQLCDPQMFLRLSEKQKILIFYIGNSKRKVVSPSGRVFGLHEQYFKWGDEGIALFLVQAVVLSEARHQFNIFKRGNDSHLLQEVLDWIRRHSFRPELINSYTKVVQKWEQAHSFCSTSLHNQQLEGHIIE